MYGRLMALSGLALWSLGAAAAQSAPAPVVLAPMFQRYAVVQRDRPVPVWGHAAPGQRVEASLAGRTGAVVAGADGRWRIDLPAVPAGIGLTLSVRGGDGDVTTVPDLAAGDVFLCSGQSNMEFEVRKVTNAETEIAAANDSGLRLLSVVRASLPALSTTLDPVGTWATAAPEAVRNFSAACYFMGRELPPRASVSGGRVRKAGGAATTPAPVRPGTDPASTTATGCRYPARASGRGPPRNWRPLTGWSGCGFM